ncbi:shikimate dehydrogenase [Herbihabitans rhizosphaerae]|uniref:Shikimate dehydrogenase n=1 Tax=Herbihabitans rhizosphaerae TaxID=1872711 RepID=A0A4Q7KH50_9PSEU|nr:shikimate dehydrogenase [Herbihabitans rhizosphaerae]RZS32168.1 shikimate dehydrogenase [Herbihabitans rhizosphaerae]
MTRGPANAAVGGATRLYGVLGDPITQVRAPAMVNELFAVESVDAVLVPIHVTAVDLVEVFGGLRRVGNLDGLLVTIPHKAGAVELADRASVAASVAGGANALRRESDGRWYADNFDGVGFVAGLRRGGHDPAGARVTLVGTGGAGSAIAPALLDAGVDVLRLCDRDTARADALAQRLDRLWPGRTAATPTPVLDKVDIAVNATPLGMSTADPLPFDPAAIGRPGLVADVIMTPEMTPLLAAASAEGHAVHLGRHMLTEQLSLYREFFQLRSDQSATRERSARAAST